MHPNGVGWVHTNGAGWGGLRAAACPKMPPVPALTRPRSARAPIGAGLRVFLPFAAGYYVSYLLVQGEYLQRRELKKKAVSSAPSGR